MVSIGSFRAFQLSFHLFSLNSWCPPAPACLGSEERAGYVSTLGAPQSPLGLSPATARGLRVQSWCISGSSDQVLVPIMESQDFPSCPQCRGSVVSLGFNWHKNYRSEEHLGGSVGWTSDFVSGDDLSVCEFEPCIGLAAVSAEPASDPLSSSPICILSKINKTLKKNLPSS